MSLEELCKAAMASMGTKAERMAAHRKRSKEFNERCAIDFENQKVTPELLAKRCTL
jgi:hypothetical protein